MKTKLFFIFSFALTLNVIAQVPSYVPTTGLVGWFPFSGNANDESGNGHGGNEKESASRTDDGSSS